MEEIKKWLDSERNYDLGLILLGRYHKNRMLKLNLERKKIPEKLEYELRKISGLKRYKVKLPKKSTGKVEGGVESPKTPKPSTIPTPVEMHMAEGKVIIVDPESRKVKKEDLPEHLQVIYDQNVDNYRHSRSIHEKLKLMKDEPPEARAPFVSELTVLDKAIREGWAMIDNWDGKIPDPPKDPIPPVVDHKRINANRKYIATQKKKLAELNESDPEKASKIKAKVQERVNELKMAGEELAEKTIRELKELGIEA